MKPVHAPAPGASPREALGRGKGSGVPGWLLLELRARRATHLKPRGPLVSSVSFRSGGASFTLRRDGQAPLDPLSAYTSPPPGVTGRPAPPAPSLEARHLPFLARPGVSVPQHFMDTPSRAGGRG